MIFVIVAQRQQMYRYKFKNIHIYLCNDSFRDRITGRETFEMFEVNEHVSNSHNFVTWIDSEVFCTLIVGFYGYLEYLG